jgi:site-specific recombinase XerC
MTSYHAANERMKRQYFAYLAEAQGHSDSTIDAVAKAIARFEEYTKWRDFKRFHIEQAKGFKHSLAGQRGQRSGEPLSKATLYATLTAVKRFFVWLAGQPGYKSRISYSDAEYFNLSTKETRIAKATRPARVPTLEQIRSHHLQHARDYQHRTSEPGADCVHNIDRCARRCDRLVQAPAHRYRARADRP